MIKILTIDGREIAANSNNILVNTFKCAHSLHGWVPNFSDMTCSHELFPTIRIERYLPGTEAMWIVDERDRKHLFMSESGGVMALSPDTEALEEEYKLWVAKMVFET